MSATDKVQTRPARSVRRVLKGWPASDGAGVKLNRVIGTPDMPDLDPFLMLDEFRSDDPNAYIAGFPDHPHRGFETVTYMLAGRIRHGDNRGNVGLLRPGSVQWMTAGRGIVHSEMPEQEDGLMWGFQLWINLPAKDKMTEPRYRDLEPEAIPVATPGDGISVKVIAGAFAGVKGPAGGGDTRPVYLDVRLEPGRAVEVPLPEAHAAFAYVYDGTAGFGSPTEGRLSRGTLVVFDDGPGAVLAEAGVEGGHFILIAGRPLREPVVKYGPFVMNTEAEIEQAVRDYRAGRF